MEEDVENCRFGEAEFVAVYVDEENCRFVGQE